LEEKLREFLDFSGKIKKISDVSRSIFNETKVLKEFLLAGLIRQKTILQFKKKLTRLIKRNLRF
jgi:hypothetical protein